MSISLAERADVLDTVGQNQIIEHSVFLGTRMALFDHATLRRGLNEHHGDTATCLIELIICAYGRSDIVVKMRYPLSYAGVHLDTRVIKTK